MLSDLPPDYNLQEVVSINHHAHIGTGIGTGSPAAIGTVSPDCC